MTIRLVLASGIVLLAVGSAIAREGTESTGNTDGVLTWTLGRLEPGETAREVVLFAFDDTYEKLVRRLEDARRDLPAALEVLTRPQPGTPHHKGQQTPSVVWIRNASTDFALAGPGSFFWEGGRATVHSLVGFFQEK